MAMSQKSDRWPTRSDLISTAGFRDCVKTRSLSAKGPKLLPLFAGVPGSDHVSNRTEANRDTAKVKISVPEIRKNP